MTNGMFSKAGDLISSLPAGIGKVGLDLEADSLYRYKERICLVQVCFADEVKLVDPLAGESMSGLVDWLSSAKIWMHGADYDMSLMMGEWEMVPPLILDTQIGAQLLGHEKFGYASLVHEYFDVELSKGSQKADWGKRPLSDKMLEYAVNDVRFLLPLAGKIEAKLRELGRYQWFLESCEAARQRVLSRLKEERESWRIGGSGKLKSDGLRYLKAIWEWRDREAEEWNKPSYMVATNKDLIAWSVSLASGERWVAPAKLRGDRMRRLRDAIEKARGIPREEWPERPKRVRVNYDETFEERLKVELAKRNEIAEELGIDPSVISPRAAFEQIVGGKAQPAEVMLKWQREVLGFD